MNTVFGSADVLLPAGLQLETWAVIACDQFTSQKEYWRQARALTKESRTTLSMILPEAELDEGNREARIASIHAAMEREAQAMTKYPSSFVYVERTLQSGKIRRGVVGLIDLEAYDYHDHTDAAIRATEKTVVERIPPRMDVRRGAALDLPHVILLCDDERDALLGGLEKNKDHLTPLYDFDAMLGGGRLRGWLVQDEFARKFEAAVAAYEQDRKEAGSTLLYCVGDGNHSLATAKSCYEEWKKAHPGEACFAHPMRYALVELENIRDDAQQFEPIHRIVMHADVPALLKAAEEKLSSLGEQSKIRYVTAQDEGVLAGGLYPVGALQKFLDAYLSCHAGEIDYIHGEEALEALVKKENCVGFMLPAMDKTTLFDAVQGGGVLPRKTFSMGHAQEKRYYLEARSLEEK